MLTKFDFLSASAPVTINFNTEGGPYPIDHFDPHYEGGLDEEQAKSQVMGIFPEYAIPSKLILSIEGAILGNDSSDFNAKLKALKSAIMPPVTEQILPKLGTIFLRLDGESEDYQADVTFDSWPEMPRDATGSPSGPGYGRFMISWKTIDLPCMIGSSSGARYWL